MATLLERDQVVTKQKQAAPMQGDTRAQKAETPSVAIAFDERKATRANPPKAAAEKLNFWYGTNHALKNIDLPIAENQVTALIGPVGLRQEHVPALLQPHARPAAGDEVPGRDHAAARQRQPRGAGDGPDRGADAHRHGVPEAEPVPEDRVRERRLRTEAARHQNRTELAERVEKALRGAAIWDEVKDRLNDSALALSGGQMQRVCIARALATEPELLLFDEPTSALDPIATAKIEELITELRQRVTVLIVTHNMQQAARVSDFTAFMYLGELVEMDSTSKIFTNPSKKATEDYITGRYG